MNAAANHTTAAAPPPHIAAGSTAPAVTLDHITKTYDKGKILAVNDVSFSVGKGELFGLIGADGAGKSTLFRILTTLVLPDQGSATLAGFDTTKDFRKIRGCVGYMPGKFSLYQDLTVEENLNFFATLFGTTIKENYALIRDIYEQIEPFRTRRAGKLSGGMKQKLALCCALVHKPTVLLLDEPTTGVDAVSRREFWEMLRKLKEQGITILVSTPYMDEADRCDRIALIQKGNMLSIDTPQRIMNAYPEKLYAVRTDSLHKALLDIRQYPNALSAYAFGEFLHVSFKNGSITSTPSHRTPDSAAAAPGPHPSPSTAPDPAMAAASASTTEPTALKNYLEQKSHTHIEIKEIGATIEDSFIRLMADNPSAPSSPQSQTSNSKLQTPNPQTPQP